MHRLMAGQVSKGNSFCHFVFPIVLSYGCPKLEETGWQEQQKSLEANSYRILTFLSLKTRSQEEIILVDEDPS